MTAPHDADIAGDLDALRLAQRQLADAADRLASANVRALALADATNWQTPCAARFRSVVQRWCDDVRMLSYAASIAGDDVSRARAVLATQSAGPGL